MDVHIQWTCMLWQLLVVYNITWGNLTHITHKQPLDAGYFSISCTLENPKYRNMLTQLAVGSQTRCDPSYDRRQK